jgi:hypothetical protein
MVAEAPLQNLIAGGGKCADSSIHGNRLVEAVLGNFLQMRAAICSLAHHDQRHGILRAAEVTPAFHEAARALEIAVYDDGVNFLVSEFVERGIDVLLHVHSDVKAAENAFDYADF